MGISRSTTIRAARVAASTYSTGTSRPESSSVGCDDLAPPRVEAGVVANHQGLPQARGENAHSALPRELREVVLLKEFEELTFQEIADALQIPLSTVKSRLYTALRQLRLKLERFQLEGAPR